MKQYRVYYRYYAYTDFEAENDEQAGKIASTLEPTSEMIFDDDWDIEEFKNGFFYRKVE